MVHVRPDGIVDSALRASDDGWRDSDNARWHGVAVKTIRRWRRLYQRRGQPRGGEYTRARCPRCDGESLDDAAYAELFGWYLGDGHIALHRRGIYGLRVYNDEKYQDDNARLLELFQRVKPGSSPFQQQRHGCIATGAWWKHWPCLFPQHGPGLKHRRQLGMAVWQWEIIQRHPAEFLRGLFHSDGARVQNWATKVVAGRRRRYDYARWQFVNESAEIMQWCRDGLELVGVEYRQTKPRVLSVSRRQAVARLDELIGLKS